MKVFKVVVFYSLVALMSCTSATSSKSNLSMPQSSQQIQVPGLQKIGDVPSGKRPQEILCVDSQHCWLQEGPSLWRSLNGGQSWSLANTPTQDESLRKYDFYSEQVGWAISGANLYKTKDGGQSWVQQQSPFEKQGEIKSLQVLDGAGTIWLGGGLFRPQTKEELKHGVPNNARLGENVIEEAIFRSDDAGVTWQRQPVVPLLIGRILDVRFFDANHGIALGERVLYYTIDGGGNWSIAHFSKSCVRQEYLADTYEAQPISVAMLDSKSWWLTYSDGRIVKSEDGGHTWCDLVQPGMVSFDQGGPQYFRFLYFANRDHGWALGWDRYLYETKDGGASWTRTTSSVRFDSATFPDRSHGFFVSSAGVFRVTSAT